MPAKKKTAPKKESKEVETAADKGAIDISETMQQFTAAPNFHEVKSRNNILQEFQKVPSPAKILSSSHSDDVYFSPPQNLVDAVQETPQEVEESYLEEESLLESTLLGQVHVHSMDDEIESANEQSESVAEWWDKSYAHTQDEHINSEIRNALSNSKDSISVNESGNVIDEDSDDDVFFGLDQISPNSKVPPQQKSASKKVRSGGRGGDLRTIESEDDSDFDKIMEDRESSSPQRNKKIDPPPPPKSTPPNKEKKKNLQQQNSDMNFNGISVFDLDNSSEAKKQILQATETARNAVDVKLSEKVKAKDTIRKPAYDESTLGNAGFTNDDTITYGDGTFEDGRSYSSKSTRSDGSYTYGSATLESMALNKRERRKWSDWDRKDQDTVFSGYTDDYTMNSNEMNAIMERRALAH
jgi:hypothetical protein